MAEVHCRDSFIGNRCHLTDENHADGWHQSCFDSGSGAHIEIQWRVNDAAHGGR